MKQMRKERLPAKKKRKRKKTVLGCRSREHFSRN